jgi:hypothetical protein
MKLSTKRQTQIWILSLIITVFFVPSSGCFPPSYSPPKSPPSPPVERKTITYPDGSRYEGPVLNGKAHGNGTLTYPDERRYTGPFLDGQPDGFGLMTYPDSHAEKVEWRDGKMIRKF